MSPGPGLLRDIPLLQSGEVHMGSMGCHCNGHRYQASSDTNAMVLVYTMLKDNKPIYSFDSNLCSTLTSHYGIVLHYITSYSGVLLDVSLNGLLNLLQQPVHLSKWLLKAAMNTQNISTLQHASNYDKTLLTYYLLVFPVINTLRYQFCSLVL